MSWEKGKGGESLSPLSNQTASFLSYFAFLWGKIITLFKVLWMIDTILLYICCRKLEASLVKKEKLWSVSGTRWVNQKKILFFVIFYTIISVWYHVLMIFFLIASCAQMAPLSLLIPTQGKKLMVPKYLN